MKFKTHHGTVYGANTQCTVKVEVSKLDFKTMTPILLNIKYTLYTVRLYSSGKEKNVRTFDNFDGQPFSHRRCRPVPQLLCPAASSTSSIRRAAARAARSIKGIISPSEGEGLDHFLP